MKILDPDQDQWITGRTGRAMQAQPGPSPVDQLGAHWQTEKWRSKGDGRWESKKLCSTCEQGCCGRSILAVASKDKHLGLKLHIVTIIWVHIK